MPETVNEPAEMTRQQYVQRAIDNMRDENSSLHRRIDELNVQKTVLCTLLAEQTDNFNRAVSDANYAKSRNELYRNALDEINVILCREANGKTLKRAIKAVIDQF